MRCSSSPTVRSLRVAEANGLPGAATEVKPVGWLGFTDELRPSHKALQGFRDAGITLKVISETTRRPLRRWRGKPD